MRAVASAPAEPLRNTFPDREPYPEVFIGYRDLLALQQRWGEAEIWQNERSIGLLSFAVRVRGNPAAAVPAITRIIRSADANAGIDAILPIDRLVANSVARPRFYALLLGAFAGVAGLLAAIGIYGVLAYAVAQRTREIGIRMALGARRAQVLALVLRNGAMLITVGLAMGLFAAAAGTRLLQGMLFGITPLDPKTFLAVPVLFGLVAMVASYLPARRATKIDPIEALRAE
jgi:putative ABC transport system permease protein